MRPDITPRETTAALMPSPSGGVLHVLMRPRPGNRRQRDHGEEREYEKEVDAGLVQQECQHVSDIEDIVHHESSIIARRPPLLPSAVRR